MLTRWRNAATKSASWAESVKWGKRGARINAIAPGIIVTPLAIDEFNGPRGDFYKNMFANCPAGRPGTADEVANVAELLMSDKGAFITGSTFLIGRRRHCQLFLWAPETRSLNPRNWEALSPSTWK